MVEGENSFQTLVFNYIEDSDNVTLHNPIYGEISWSIGGIGASLTVKNFDDDESISITLHPNEMLNLRNRIDQVLKTLELLTDE